MYHSKLSWGLDSVPFADSASECYPACFFSHRWKQLGQTKSQAANKTHHKNRDATIFVLHDCCKKNCLPVFTHNLSVMLHCGGGTSVVVVKGEMKTVLTPLGGLVLGTGGVNVLLLVWVLMMVVVVVLLVTGVGLGVVVELDCVGTLRGGVA